MSERLSVSYNRKPCYDIVFQQSFQGLWQELDVLGCGGKRLCIVTDSKVDELYGNEVLSCLDGNCLKAEPRPMRIGRQMTVKRKVFFTARRNAWLLNMS